MESITKEPSPNFNHQEHPLKIRRSIYNALPRWYKALADFLATQGRVEIVADE
jgi:hypothetical protein